MPYTFSGLTGRFAQRIWTVLARPSDAPLPSSLANGDKDENGRDKNDHEDFFGPNQYGSHVNKNLLTGTRV